MPSAPCPSYELVVAGRRETILRREARREKATNFLKDVKSNSTREVQAALADPTFILPEQIAVEAFDFAISKSNTKVLKHMLAAKVNPNCTLQDGSSPLIKAIQLGKQASINALLKCDEVDLMFVTEYGTALSVAREIVNPIVGKVQDAIARRHGRERIPPPPPPAGGGQREAPPERLAPPLAEAPWRAEPISTASPILQVPEQGGPLENPNRGGALNLDGAFEPQWGEWRIEAPWHNDYRQQHREHNHQGQHREHNHQGQHREQPIPPPLGPGVGQRRSQAGDREDEKELDAMTQNIRNCLQQQITKSHERLRRRVEAAEALGQNEKRRADQLAQQLERRNAEFREVRRDLEACRHTLTQSNLDHGVVVTALRQQIEEHKARAEQNLDLAGRCREEAERSDAAHHEAVIRIGELEAGVTLCGVQLPRNLPDTANELRDLQSKIFALGGKINQEIENIRQCPVCMDASKDTALGCGHQLCRTCSNAIRNRDNQCPMCRRVITSAVSLI